jgi:hypothetical protein
MSRRNQSAKLARKQPKWRSDRFQPVSQTRNWQACRPLIDVVGCKLFQNRLDAFPAATDESRFLTQSADLESALASRILSSWATDRPALGSRPPHGRQTREEAGGRRIEGGAKPFGTGKKSMQWFTHNSAQSVPGLAEQPDPPSNCLSGAMNEERRIRAGHNNSANHAHFDGRTLKLISGSFACSNHKEQGL